MLLVSQIAIYPGSFDPITLGHLSVLSRATGLFSKTYLVVVHNPRKQPMFSVSDRIELARSSVIERGITGSVEVVGLETGLLVDFARELGAKAILKGFRTANDVEYELPMAQVNRDLSGIETVFLASEPGYGFVSSSLVKEVSSLGGDVSHYVSKSVATALEARR